jgi:hypothetical protein
VKTNISQYLGPVKKLKRYFNTTGTYPVNKLKNRQQNYYSDVIPVILTVIAYLLGTVLMGKNRVFFEKYGYLVLKSNEDIFKIARMEKR